jgi:hypothetical protein
MRYFGLKNYVTLYIVIYTGGTKVTFQDVLRFATGLETLPAVGFAPTPTVTFRHRRDKTATQDKFLALGNTCANQILLPVDERHRRFVRFKEDLELAFVCGLEFTSDVYLE